MLQMLQVGCDKLVTRACSKHFHCFEVHGWSRTVRAPQLKSKCSKTLNGLVFEFKSIVCLHEKEALCSNASLLECRVGPLHFENSQASGKGPLVELIYMSNLFLLRVKVNLMWCERRSEYFG